KEVTVQYASSAGTATPGGVDYFDVEDTLTFAPGETAQTFSVPVVNDLLDEPDETVQLALSDPWHAHLGDPDTATLTIVDDDFTPKVKLAPTYFAVQEAETTVTVTAALSGRADLPVTVDWAAEDGTAVSPGDFEADSGTLTFEPGQTR